MYEVEGRSSYTFDFFYLHYQIGPDHPPEYVAFIVTPNEDLLSGDWRQWTSTDRTSGF